MAKIITVSDEAIAERAGQLVATALQEAIEATGHGRLAIAGGSATAPLASIRKTLKEDWDLVWLTWVDERCVDFDDGDSNRGAVYRSHGLSDLCPPGLELPLWLDGETPTGAAHRVEESLADDFGGSLDVTLLGMGPDGHIASLFPGHEVLTGESSGNIAHVHDSPKPPAARMTLTLPFLRKSSQHIMVAMGEPKREALERIIAEDAHLPASTLSNLTILTNLKLRETDA